MGIPKKSWKSGNVECAMFEGEFDGKVTYSFKFQKNSYNPKTKESKNSDFYNANDMLDIVNIAMMIANKNIKEREIKPKSEAVTNDVW